ncbi:hypothetical protein PS15m_006830 [Mucor circinelloides]
MLLFPKTLSKPKSTIHFGCLDLFDMFELRGNISAKIKNQINAESGIKLATSTLNLCRLYYKRFLQFAEEVVAKKLLLPTAVECTECATSDVVAYMMDDCASLKRKHTANVDVKHFPLEDGTKIWIKQDDLSQFGNNQLM